WQVLNAADYGDATSRERLFVVGRRDARAEFPAPTHSRDGDEPGTEPRRPAAEIIDWTDPGESIWGRDRPLVNNTMQRIAEGLRRHGSDDLAAFADALDDLGARWNNDEDVTFVGDLQEDAVPLADVADVVEERCEPFLVKYYGTSTAKPVDEPMDTITANGKKFALCEPYLLRQQSGGVPPSVEDPVPTISKAGAISKIEPAPFVLPRNGTYGDLHSNSTYDPDERPLHTVTAKNTDGYLVTPYLVPYYGEREGQRPRTHDIEEPLPTVTATGSDPYLAQPYLVEYNGGSHNVDEPLPTVTTKDRFALILPETFPWGLDIRFRMLKPRELGAAMGFPGDYEIVGNKTETTKQIGNAVPVNLAKALCRTLLTGDAPSLQTYTSTEGVVSDD
ncbi:cytosine methyltransferase, partial [Halobacteriales archaeon SW_6_65_15]